MKTIQHTTKWTKTLAAAGLAGILLLSSSGFSSAHAQVPSASGKGTIMTPTLAAKMVTSKKIHSSEKWLQTDIALPVFQGLADTEYQDQLNDILESHAFKDLAQWEKKAAEAAALAKKKDHAMNPYQLSIHYELTSDGLDNGLVSLKTTLEGTRTNNPETIIATYNFMNEPEAKRVTLEDLFGSDYLAILNTFIKSAIAANPELYFKGEDGFKSVNPEQSFYVKDGYAYIVFQKYAIAPGSTGTPEFAVKIPDHKDVHEAARSILPPGKSYMGKNGKLMVPLASALRPLKFEVTWNSKSKTTDISKAALWSSVSLNKDSYFLGKTAPRQLGAAPEMKKGSVYVPIEFLSDILNLKVVQDKQGQITISYAKAS